MSDKVHLKSTNPVDFREQCQTEHEYTNQTECGYVRKIVTRIESDVTCHHCKNIINKSKNYEQF